MSRLEEAVELLQVPKLRRDLLELQVHWIVSRSGVDRTDHQTFEFQPRQGADFLLQTWQRQRCVIIVTLLLLKYLWGSRCCCLKNWRSFGSVDLHFWTGLASFPDYFKALSVLDIIFSNVLHFPQTLFGSFQCFFLSQVFILFPCDNFLATFPRNV